MASHPEKRRYPRRKPYALHQELKLSWKGADDSINQIEVRLLNTSRGGAGVEADQAMDLGQVAELSGEVDNAVGVHLLSQRCRVCGCAPTGSGAFVVSLAFEASAEEESAKDQPKVGAPDADYYETLQVSPKADADTIQRVFRIIAQRYHPDNLETGNAELFREVAEAHRVLSDPEKRAAYDAQRTAQNATRVKLFDSWQSSRGVDAEKRKRTGILTLLYGKRLTEPHQPAMSVRDFEDQLGCPKEHLEFTLWFLKENHWITRSDNNRFEITIQGVAAFEAQETSDAQPSLLQLPAPIASGQ